MISIIVVESPWHFEFNLDVHFPNGYVLSLSAFGHP